MVDVNADLWKAIMNLSDSDISNENAEYLLDLAIDSLNLYGANIINLSGTSPNKSVSVTSKQKAGIFIAARAIYYGFYKGLENVGIGGITVTHVDLFSNPTVLESIKKAAYQLKSFTFKVAEDTSGIE